MKKPILLLSALCFSFSLFATSNLEFVNMNPNSNNVSGPNDDVMETYVQVKNNGPIGITVKVRRTINNLATNHVANFCFAGYCYVASQDLSLPIDINPGSVTDSVHVTLKSDLNPMSTNGVTTITYTAFNVDDESDSVSISYTYHAGPDGVNELLSGSKFLSNAYPNPAHRSSLVSYNLPFVNNAQLVVSNMLGSEMKRIQLTEKTGSVELPVSTLPEGIYYYTLMNEGKPLISKRLMVSHN